MAWLDVAAILVGLREGFEACLLVGILLGMVTRLGHAGQRRTVWTGALLGLAASVAAGSALAGLEGWYEGSHGDALIEVATGVVALALVVYMVLWMQRQTAGMAGGLHTKMVEALSTGRSGVVAALAFLVVLREGIETVLFYAARAATEPWLALATSGVLGLAAAALLAAGVFRLSVRVNMERFYALTGYLLILLAAGILVGAVGAAEELGADHHLWTPSPQAWDLSGPLPSDGGNALGNLLHVLVGYEAQPTWAQVVAYVLFVGGLGAWHAWMQRQPRHRQTA